MASGEHQVFLHVRDPQRDRTLGQPHQHLTTSRSTYAQPGDVREGLPLPQVPAAQQPVLLQHEDQEGPLVRPNGRPKFYQVRKGQLEATATPYASRASTHPRRPHREGAVLHRHQTPPQRRHLPSIDASLTSAPTATASSTPPSTSTARQPPPPRTYAKEPPNTSTSSPSTH